MKTIGMLGGMSWNSTAEYYRLANQLVADRLGGSHSARIVLDSVDFADIEAMQNAGEWDGVGRLLAARASAVQTAGAEVIVLCTNTMHLVIDAITEAVGVPVLHIADATADAITASGLSRIGLLGTAFTMEQAFYRDRIESHGIEVLTPDASERALVHRVIYDELVRGIVSDDSRDAYRGVIERLAARGAQGVVLGCTEIELLIAADDSPIPVFATTRIHVEAAVAAALAP